MQNYGRPTASGSPRGKHCCQAQWHAVRPPVARCTAQARFVSKINPWLVRGWFGATGRGWCTPWLVRGWLLLIYIVQAQHLDRQEESRARARRGAARRAAVPALAPPECQRDTTTPASHPPRPRLLQPKSKISWGAILDPSCYFTLYHVFGCLGSCGVWRSGEMAHIQIMLAVLLRTTLLYVVSPNQPRTSHGPISDTERACAVQRATGGRPAPSFCDTQRATVPGSNVCPLDCHLRWACHSFARPLEC